MVHIKDGFHRLLGPVSVSQNIAVFLLLTHFCGGRSQEIGPPRPVMAMVGDDIVLPCQLDPPMNAVSMTLEWGRPDLNPRFVHVWHAGQELLTDQNEAYKGRTSVSIEKLKHGDMSLTLSTVKISDNGMYRCYTPKQSKEYFVELLVGAVSSPAISLAGIDKATRGVMLDCRSEGWYPEPEVLWLDGEGNLLSAGPPETVRGPDDLYTVSSRVTVEKRHSNSFTCRVQQKNTNQTRETHIHLPEDFFVAPSTCTPSIVFSVLFGLLLVLAVVLCLCFVWKLKQNKTVSQPEMKTTTQQPLMEAEGSREHLMTEIKKMEEELEKKEEEQKDMTQVIGPLSELMKELEKQKEKLTDQMQKSERLVEENEKKVQSVEEEGDRTANRAQGYFKLKEILTENNWNLNERKKEQQLLQMNTEKLKKKTMDEVNRITEKKKKVENDMEQMKKQLEEIQRKLESERGGRK
ncbi:butyrophilin subfamily 2 member A1-like [Sebastes umbrosus]|uniref:butyrophilin subfamily 2 member A1-like n=1 Tax=Sebastes umbrosus TaxID=72105 RepID=UPI00189EA8B5|nr:butyrophilin subfamily 2 member A1-like [Sebastes umbrosus]